MEIENETYGTHYRFVFAAVRRDVKMPFHNQMQLTANQPWTRTYVPNFHPGDHMSPFEYSLDATSFVSSKVC